MYARWSATDAACLLVSASHHVHVGAWSSQIAQVATEVRHLGYLLHLAQYALLRAAHDELALMRRYGAEGTSAKASAVHVHRELYHVEGRYALAVVFRVGQTCVGQVEAMVQFLCGERRVGRVHHHIFLARTLYQARGMHLVALLLHVAEVLGMQAWRAQAILVGVKHYVSFLGHHLLGRHHGLRQCHLLHHRLAEGLACHQRLASHGVVLQRLVVGVQKRFQYAHQFQVHLVAHAIGYHVGPRVHEYRRTYALLPIVVVRHTAQRGLYAAQHHGHVGI